jgi:hypothetical protein
MMSDPIKAARLAEASEALHQLIIGKRTVKVMVDGQSVEFTAANRADLEAYISRLTSELAGAQPYRALRVVF